MRRYLPVVVAAAVIIGSGLAHGLWTDRWATSEGPQRAAAKLDSISLFFADWDGEAMVIDPRHLEIGEIAGYLGRRYVHRGTGTQVSVLMVCGRPGPITVHTPDICYDGAGYVIRNEGKQTVEWGEPKQSAVFHSAVLTKPDPTSPDQLQIYWAWNATGNWETPQLPRMAFARNPALYKLYVVQYMRPGNTKQDQANCLELMRDLMPQIQLGLIEKK